MNDAKKNKDVDTGKMEHPSAASTNAEKPHARASPKNSRYFSKLGVTMTGEIAAALVRDRQVTLRNLRSQKTGREYDAVVLLEMDEAGNAQFSMRFPKKKGR